MKNMSKQAQQGRAIVQKSQALDLTANEAAQIFKMYKGGCTLDALWDVITTAYYSGIATGTRHGKRQAIEGNA
jgi:RNAse (barnase) inhibitor barstar